MLVSKQEKSPRQLSQEQIMEGLPPVNIGALFMPPIWGAANGIWLAILYYPVWLLADNLFYSVYLDPQPLTVGLSIVAALVLAFRSCWSGLCVSARPFHGQNQGAVFEKPEEVGYCHDLACSGHDRCSNVLQLGYSSDGWCVNEAHRSFLRGQSLDAR